VSDGLAKYHFKSPVWTHFRVCIDNNLKAACHVCSERILSGSNTPKSLTLRTWENTYGWLTASWYRMSGVSAKEYGIVTALNTSKM